MVHTEPQNNARVTAVYELDLKFTRQKLVGTFLGDRLHTLVGWRRSSFNVSRGRDFYNYVTGLTFRVPEVPGIPQPRVIRITTDSINYGGVLHLAKWLAAYFNYAESMALSSGVGGALLTPGQLRGPGR